MYTRKNEEAVSPVIGVILMVAITVILAAVIAAFVFGMAGNIQKTKVVAATEKRVNSSYVTITYQGGQDAGTLLGIGFTVDGVNVTLSGYGSASTTNGNEVVSATQGAILPVGQTVTVPAGNPGKNVVVGVAYFTDGSQQVLVDTTI
jgi:flagellin-like protein